LKWSFPLLFILLKRGSPDDIVLGDDEFTLHEASATPIVALTHHAPGLFVVVNVVRACRPSR
jgi:hypothetical protein